MYDALDKSIKSDYGRLVDALKSHFVPEENQHLYLSDFRCRKQKSDESPEEFAADLVALLERAMPSATVTDKTSRDILLREQFIFGSNDEVQRELVLKNPKNFREAVSTSKQILSSLAFASRFSSSHVDSSAVASVAPGTRSLTEEVQLLRREVELMRTSSAGGACAAVHTPR